MALPTGNFNCTAFLPLTTAILWYRSPNAPTETLSTVSPSATRERMEASMAVDPEPLKMTAS